MRNVFIKGNKEQDRLGEEYAEDNVGYEDGRVGKTSQGAGCDRQ